jgi:hypothetical protein
MVLSGFFVLKRQVRDNLLRTAPGIGSPLLSPGAACGIPRTGLSLSFAAAWVRRPDPARKLSHLLGGGARPKSTAWGNNPRS